MDQAPREMRLVELPDGWATALESQVSPNRYAIVLGVVIAFAIGMSSMVALDSPIPILAMLPLVAAVVGVLPARHFTRVALDGHGVKISTVYSHTMRPTLDRVRSGEDPRFALAPLRDTPHDLRFSEMRALGFTDYSIWFEMDAGRVEIPLDSTRRSDIQRLHDAIAEVWARHRDGLEVSEEDARAQRARLKSTSREV